MTQFDLFSPKFIVFFDVPNQEASPKILHIDNFLEGIESLRLRRAFALIDPVEKNLVPELLGIMLVPTFMAKMTPQKPVTEVKKL